MKTLPSAAPRAWSWLACLSLGFTALGCSDSGKTGGHPEPSVDASGGAMYAPDGALLPATDAGGNTLVLSDGAVIELPPGLDGGVDGGTALQKCAPTGGGPYWLLEGETGTAMVRCATGLGLPAGSFTIDDLPAGATFDATSNTLSWTPTLSQGAVYQLTVRVPSLGESGTIKVGVADKFDDPNNVPIADPLTYTEEYGLPVVHLTVDPTINDDAYTNATVIYRGHQYANAQAQYRGTFSRSFPKQSYTLKFTKEDKFGDPNVAGGFNAKRKITLISPFNDNSYVRSRSVFDLWNAMDPSHIQVKSYSAVVFLNGAYWGLYTVMDHVDGYLMEDFGLAQSGNLYKARTHTANWTLTRSTDDGSGMKQALDEGFTKEEGQPEAGQPGAFDDLDDLVNFVATADSATFLSQVDQRFVRKEYEDWFLLVSYWRANDSIDKNSYHYHDPSTPSPFHYIPWDMDESLGQNFATVREPATESAPETGTYTNANYLFKRLLSEPTIGGPLRARYGALLHGGAFDLAPILARLDAAAAEVHDAALRDESKWRQAYRTFTWVTYRQPNDWTTHEQEVQYVRQWMMDRYAFIDSMY